MWLAGRPQEQAAELAEYRQAANLHSRSDARRESRRDREKLARLSGSQAGPTGAVADHSLAAAVSLPGGLAAASQELPGVASQGFAGGVAGVGAGTSGVGSQLGAGRTLLPLLQPLAQPRPPPPITQQASQQGVSSIAPGGVPVAAPAPVPAPAPPPPLAAPAPMLGADGQPLVGFARLRALAAAARAAPHAQGAGMSTSAGPTSAATQITNPGLQQAPAAAPGASDMDQGADGLAGVGREQEHGAGQDGGGLQQAAVGVKDEPLSQVQAAGVVALLPDGPEPAAEVKVEQGQEIKAEPGVVAGGLPIGSSQQPQQQQQQQQLQQQQVVVKEEDEENEGPVVKAVMGRGRGVRGRAAARHVRGRH